MAIVDDDHFLRYYTTLYNEEATALASSPSFNHNNRNNVVVLNNYSSNGKDVYHTEFSREYLSCQYRSLSLPKKSKPQHQYFHDHHHIGGESNEICHNNNINNHDNHDNHEHNKDKSNENIDDTMDDEETTASCTRSSLSSRPLSTISSESDSDTNSDGQSDVDIHIKDKTDSDTNSDDNEHIRIINKIIYNTGDSKQQELFRLFSEFQDTQVTVSFVTNPVVIDSLFININAHDENTKLISLFKKLTKDKIFSHELSYEEVKKIRASDFPELPWLKDMYPVPLYVVLLARIELAMWISYHKVLEHHNFKLPPPLLKSNGMLSIKKVKSDEENQDESLWMIMSKSPLTVLPSWSVMLTIACTIEELKGTWKELNQSIQKDILTHFPFVKCFYIEALRNKSPLNFLERLVLCPLRYVCHDDAKDIKHAYDYIGKYKTESTIPPPDALYNTIDDLIINDTNPNDETKIPSFKLRCIAKPPEVHPSLSGLKRIRNKEKSNCEPQKLDAERMKLDADEKAKARKIKDEIEKQQRAEEEAHKLEIAKIEEERLAKEARKKQMKKKRKKKEREKKRMMNDGVIDYSDTTITCNVNEADNSNNSMCNVTIKVDQLSIDYDENDLSHCADSDSICSMDGIVSEKDSSNDNGHYNRSKIKYSIAELYSIRDESLNKEYHIEANTHTYISGHEHINRDDINTPPLSASDETNSHKDHKHHQTSPNFHNKFDLNGNNDLRALEKRITKNIRNYNYVMSNRMEAHKLTRLAVTSELRSIVSSLWPHATVCVYGSCITGLALPSSDIDFVVKLSQQSNEYFNQKQYVPVYYHWTQQNSTTNSPASSPLNVPPIQRVASPEHPEASNTLCQSIVGDIAERAYWEANPVLLAGASLSKLPPRYLGNANGHCPNQHEVLNALFALTAQLHMVHWTTSVNPIPTAAVPVVKMQVLAEQLLCLPHIQASVSSLYYEELLQQNVDSPPLIPFHLVHGVTIPVDISIEAGEHKGISSCEYIQHALQMRSPILSSVVKVVKGLLQQAGYNMPFNGGLSSYSIFIMVCAIYDMEMICEIRRLAAKDTNKPNQITDAHITQAASKLTEGTLFLNFLRFFSHYFDPSVAGIDTTNPSIVFELSAEQRALIGIIIIILIVIVFVIVNFIIIQVQAFGSVILLIKVILLDHLLLLIKYYLHHNYYLFY